MAYQGRQIKCPACSEIVSQIYFARHRKQSCINRSTYVFSSKRGRKCKDNNLEVVKGPVVDYRKNVTHHMIRYQSMCPSERIGLKKSKYQNIRKRYSYPKPDKESIGIQTDGDSSETTGYVAIYRDQAITDHQDHLSDGDYAVHYVEPVIMRPDTDLIITKNNASDTVETIIQQNNNTVDDANNLISNSAHSDSAADNQGNSSSIQQIQLEMVLNDDNVNFATKMNSFFMFKGMPYYCYDVRGDGRCFYRALAYHIFGDEKRYEDVKTCIRNNATQILKDTHMEYLTEEILDEVKKRTNKYADNYSVHFYILSKIYKKNIHLFRWNKQSSSLNKFDETCTYGNDVETIHIMHNGEPQDSDKGHYIAVVETKQ